VEVGIVRTVKDFLLNLDGLPSVKINDLIEGENGSDGFVSALFEESVEVLLLDSKDVRPNEQFKTKGGRMSIPAGDFLLGRAVNPLGVPIDGKPPLTKTKTDQLIELEQPSPGIEFRELIKEQFITGFTLVDSLIPIGKGQRELILADPRSGKTNFLIDLIVNQKNSNVICVLASIGKPLSELKNIINILTLNKAIQNTIIIAGTSSDSPPLIFLTPMAAMSIAEHFQRDGRDVLLILDDLGTHAKVYREIMLLGNRFPGRQSYPGDIFNVHGRLLERAGRFNSKAGGGSITALPVAEINLNDLTGFIPTNLMAMTDGHLLFRSTMYNKNQRPAIDISFSVSRVGKQTQNPMQNLIATQVRQVLAKAAESESISRFEFELPEETKRTLKQKQIIDLILIQPSLTYISPQVQIALLALTFTKFLLQRDIGFFEANQSKILTLLSSPKFTPFINGLLNIKSGAVLVNKLDIAMERSLR